MDQDEILMDAEERMEKAATVAHEHFQGLRTGRATAGLVERKLAIYERALRELPDDESLLVGYLRCGQEKWEYVRRR